MYSSLPNFPAFEKRLPGSRFLTPAPTHNRKKWGGKERVREGICLKLPQRKAHERTEKQSLRRLDTLRDQQVRCSRHPTSSSSKSSEAMKRPQGFFIRRRTIFLAFARDLRPSNGDSTKSYFYPIDAAHRKRRIACGEFLMIRIRTHRSLILLLSCPAVICLIGPAVGRGRGPAADGSLAGCLLRFSRWLDPTLSHRQICQFFHLSGRALGYPPAAAGGPSNMPRWTET